MLYDLENIFSDNQEITTTAVSQNVIHLAKGPLKEVTYGTPIPMRIQVTEDFEGATSVNFQIQTATDEGFTSATTLAETGAIAIANLKAGYSTPINFIPKGNLGYMRINYVVSGTATKGKVTAGIVAANEGSYQNM